MDFRITGKSNKICVTDRLMLLLSGFSNLIVQNEMELLTGIFEFSTGNYL
jgi:hypothetical protein